MNQFLQASKEERMLVFENVSERLGMSRGIVEKDFWVCFVLNYLFNEFVDKEQICFKGGTSLSKVYHLINRFSEDIDLALDWQVLGYDEKEPYLERSNRQQDLFNKQMNENTAILIREKWLPQIQNDFRLKLNEAFKLEIDNQDHQTLRFIYPQLFTESSILQEIRIEVGALAEPTPSEVKTVQSYVAEQFPNIFAKSQFPIKSVTPLRTFFEKVLILHREAHRTKVKK